MKPTVRLLPGLCLAMSLPVAAQVPTTLDTVVVQGHGLESTDANLGVTTLGASDLLPKRTSTSDTARLLSDVPGVSLFGAGGISSMPVIRGLANERLNIQVNGMGLMPACSNHMNTPLSYIDPTSVETIQVYAGVTPVSVGGDSIGGTILVDSAKPKFAQPGEDYLATGSVGAFYRSNGNARGGNIRATVATEQINITYTGSHVDANNYHAAQDFHPSGSGSAGGSWLAGDVVGSSAYRATNQDIGLSVRHGDHLLQFNVGEQRVPYEGFPNQRMDLTNNKSTTYNLAYTGQFDWGDLKANLYQQDIRHEMNMGPDRVFGEFPGMPMLSKAKVRGGKLQGNILLSDQDTLRLGVEAQYYTLHDWWTPVGGQMGPHDFWNIDAGTRDKFGVFAEWEAKWNPQWTSLLGVRGDFVRSDAGPVQGYNGMPIWAIDAAAFNAQSRKRNFNNLDLTALLRYEPSDTQAFSFGYARKTRAPSVYQLYPWSTYEMATTMNNYAGDGGGYVGNLDLKPEVAHTFSASFDWHDAARERWELSLTGYFTHIKNYISAQRCTKNFCDPGKATATTGFVVLQHTNDTADIYGLDLSGRVRLGEIDGFGKYTGTFIASYLRGKQTNTGDNLFNMMPTNLKLALIQEWGRWTNTAELELVAAKTRVSAIRNEVATSGYGLLNLRSSAQLTKSVRLDIAVENALNRYYQHPLGGAYVGQGNSMFLNSMRWGDYVPGMGRSLNASINIVF